MYVRYITYAQSINMRAVYRPLTDVYILNYTLLDVYIRLYMSMKSAMLQLL